MYELFTVEEVNLMCIFDTSNRTTLTNGLIEALPDFDEPELIDITVSTLAKLSEMSDAEFSALKLYPEYGDYDEESEVQPNGD